MKDRTWIALAGVALGAGLVVGAGGLERAAAQRTPGLIRGGGSAGVEKEPTFRFQTLEGSRATADFDRSVLKVPAYYGEPFAATPAGDQTVLWYRGADGAVRNVILTEPRALVRVSGE